jgi:hypothetical protein
MKKERKEKSMKKTGRKNVLGAEPKVLKFKVPATVYAALEAEGEATLRTPSLVARDILLNKLYSIKA